jgi:hypothetical protein
MKQVLHHHYHHHHNHRPVDGLSFLQIKKDDDDDDDDDSHVMDHVVQNRTYITTTNNYNNDNNINNINNPNLQNQFDWDTFLDTPFFDPNKILNDHPNNTNRIQRQLALWVQKDYHTMELICTGLYCIVLIIITQELLRIHIYGIENYIPFTKGIPSGHLF